MPPKKRNKGIRELRSLVTDDRALRAEVRRAMEDELLRRAERQGRNRRLPKAAQVLNGADMQENGAAEVGPADDDGVAMVTQAPAVRLIPRGVYGLQASRSRQYRSDLQREAPLRRLMGVDERSLTRVGTSSDPPLVPQNPRATRQFSQLTSRQLLALQESKADEEDMGEERGVRSSSSNVPFQITRIDNIPDARLRLRNALDRVREYQVQQRHGDRRSLELLAELSGMRGNRNLTRPQFTRLEEIMRNLGAQAGETYFDRLRRVRREMRKFSGGRRNTNIDAGVARNLAYNDLVQRMAMLRGASSVRGQNIPVFDYRVQGKVSRSVNAVRQLANGIVNALFMKIPTLQDRRNDDLVSITIPRLPVLALNQGGRYELTVFTGAVVSSQLYKVVEALILQLEEVLQSSEDIDWDVLYERALDVEVQVMKAPQANGWSPRLEIEEHFVKSTVRYIPPEAYLNDSICIPIAVLTAGLRVTDEQGVLSFPDFEEMELGPENEMFEIFDAREPCNRNYYFLPEKYQHLRYMAKRLMQEAGVDMSSKLTIDACESFAYILGVQIHVMFQETMCKRMLRFGEATNPRSITILIRDDHAFPVLKPWRLSGNGTPSFWCDFCHTCVTKSWTSARVCHHRLQCPTSKDIVEDKAKDHGVEYVHRRFNRVWNQKENCLQVAPYCFTCNRFCCSAKEMQQGRGGERLETCVSSGHNVMDNVGMGECTVCTEELPIEWPQVSDAPVNKFQHVNDHKCYLSRPDLKIGEASKYYVWDIETIAVDDVHVPIYIYARNLYNAAENYEFEGIDSFCKGVICEKFKDSTWIAHNSGGFDSTFVHSWLEDRGVMHSRIPSPMSIHRSLETVVNTLDIRFIDSYSFIPMSLAKIGPAFQLPVCKGDFPHKFSKFEHLSYEGCMPPCDSDDDWYSLHEIRASSAEKADVAVAKFKLWHHEESQKFYPHTEERWSYQRELRKYCKQDCDVLAGALQCLRDSFMGADSSIRIGSGSTAFCLCPVDPLCYLTMAQVCQQLYIAGMYQAGTGFRIAHIPLPDRKQTNAKVKWLLDEERHCKATMWKACTHLREWVADDGLPVDGFAWVGDHRHVWEYYDCTERGCPLCTSPLERNARFGCSNRDAYGKVVQRQRVLSKLGYIVHEQWTHNEADRPMVDHSFHQYDCMAAQRQRSDGGFFGGRVEVFKPMWRCREDEKIQYIDVVSLYPWVCATQRMCTGFPIVYLGDRIDRSRVCKDHPDAYFGYAHVRIRGNPDDYFGGVPRKDRETGRLVFDNSEYTVTCFLTELYERLENGAELLDVYEVWHWDEANAVEGPMAGYVAYFLRDKMECSGWKALCGRIPETDDEKAAICDDLERENLYLCRPRPEKVMDNPGGRQLAKLRLNMLWGKFVQTPTATTMKFISTYDDYVQLWYDNQVDKSSLMFRRVHDSIDFMEVKYKYNSSLRAPSNTHYYLGGSCTAQARLKLTSMLRLVGKERALYCDTDSVVYVQRPGDEVIETGEALGNWSSEMDEGVWGEEFMALAPKCYMLIYNEKGREKEKESGILKTKGVTLTAQNLKQIHAENMKKIILTEVFGDISGDDQPPFVVQAKTFNIRMNHSGDRSMTNIRGEKVVRCVYSKRKITVPDDTDVYDVHFIDTTPFY
jgi:hypothetical protein